MLYKSNKLQNCRSLILIFIESSADKFYTVTVTYLGLINEIHIWQKSVNMLGETATSGNDVIDDYSGDATMKETTV